MYDASVHPEVLDGKKTTGQVLREFLETFDVGGEVDGKVTPQEFENYYANISASIDNDDYFELMLRNTWHISEGEGWAANAANRVGEFQDDSGFVTDNREGMIARLRQRGSGTTPVHRATVARPKSGVLRRSQTTGGPNVRAYADDSSVNTAQREGFVSRLRNEGTAARRDGGSRLHEDIGRTNSSNQISESSFGGSSSSSVRGRGNGVRGRNVDIPTQDDPVLILGNEKIDPTTGVFVGMTLPGGYGELI